MEGGRLLRRRGAVTFGFLLLAAEVVGRSLTAHVDRALHVRPLAPAGAQYYPFLLLGVKIAGALVLAGLAARGVRAWALASTGERLLGERRRSPRLRPGLSPRVWLASFLGTSLLYLVHADADSAAVGRFSAFSPLLHSYALPVFAVLSVLVALFWRLARWLHAVEDYADRTLARARRVLSAALRRRLRHPRPADDRAPRRRFGLAFESRPPPLPA
ncbi:MAG TPA: hypothetical protein VFA82_07240 [Gaiellaceae bacterium]|nr:hypothetical protein [Gaiellaceae bacterium]